MALGTPPAWAGVLVGSIDAQRAGEGRLELDIWAFGSKRRRAFVEHIDVEGSLADKKTWEKMDREVERSWTSEDGREMRLARVGIDSGDGVNTMPIYAWARRRTGFVMALKGREALDAMQPIAGPTWQDVTIGGRKILKGVRLWTVGTSMLKLELYGQLQLPKPVDGEEYPDGFIYLPDGTSDEWVKQLCAEQMAMIKQRNGRVRREWQKLRDRNEALDNAVYARAIAISLGVDRWSDKQWAQLTKLQSPPAPAKKPSAGTKKPPPKKPPPPPRVAPKVAPGWLNRRGR